MGEVAVGLAARRYPGVLSLSTTTERSHAGGRGGAAELAVVMGRRDLLVVVVRSVALFDSASATGSGRRRRNCGSERGRGAAGCRAWCCRGVSWSRPGTPSSWPN